jgi:hypothetical protein
MEPERIEMLDRNQVRDGRQFAVHLWNHAMVVYEPQDSFPIERT